MTSLGQKLIEKLSPMAYFCPLSVNVNIIQETTSTSDVFTHIRLSFSLWDVDKQYSKQLFHGGLVNSQNYWPEVTRMTMVDYCPRPKAEGNSPSGHPRHQTAMK